MDNAFKSNGLDPRHPIGAVSNAIISVGIYLLFRLSDVVNAIATDFVVFPSKVITNAVTGESVVRSFIQWRQRRTNKNLIQSCKRHKKEPRVAELFCRTKSGHMCGGLDDDRLCCDPLCPMRGLLTVLRHLPLGSFAEDATARVFRMVNMHWYKHSKWANGVGLEPDWFSSRNIGTKFIQNIYKCNFGAWSSHHCAKVEGMTTMVKALGMSHEEGAHYSGNSIETVKDYVRYDEFDGMRRSDMVNTGTRAKSDVQVALEQVAQRVEQGQQATQLQLNEIKEVAAGQNEPSHAQVGGPKALLNSHAIAPAGELSWQTRRALVNFEAFYRLAPGVATVAALEQSPLGVTGWSGMGDPTVAMLTAPPARAPPNTSMPTTPPPAREMQTIPPSPKVGRAIENYERYHHLPAGSATLDQVQASSAGVSGFATAEHTKLPPRMPKAFTQEECDQMILSATAKAREEAAQAAKVEAAKQHAADTAARLENAARVEREQAAKQAAQLAEKQQTAIDALTAQLDHLRERLTADDAERAAVTAAEAAKVASKVASDPFSTPSAVSVAVANAQISSGWSSQLSKLTRPSPQPTSHDPLPQNSGNEGARGVLMGAAPRNGHVAFLAAPPSKDRKLTEQERRRARGLCELANIRKYNSPQVLSPTSLQQAHPVLTWCNTTPQSFSLSSKADSQADLIRDSMGEMSPRVEETDMEEEGEDELEISNTQMATGVASVDAGYAQHELWRKHQQWLQGRDN